ncbi:MAG: serpin family protein [Prevotella sp.]|nr:serpin family protein [Prevotella sp.]
MKRILWTITVALLMAGMVTGCNEDSETAVTPKEQIKPDSPQNSTENEEKPGSHETDSSVINMLPKAQPMKLTGEQLKLVENNNIFSTNLFAMINSLDKEKRSNFLSPISVTYLLSMLNDGAAGNSSKEIMATLGFGESDTQAINELCKAMIEGAPKVDPSVSVDISNYIAANSHMNVKLEDLFKKDMETYYQAEAASLDFSSPDALKTINDWCSQKTDGKIEKILDRLDASSLLVLMNAVNFKASWVSKFDEKNTQTETFTKDGGKTVELPMMHQEALVRFASNDTYSTLLLPYGGTNAKWYMYVLLPQDNKTVNDVLEKMEGLNWTNFFWETDIYKVDIKMPRFTTTSENDLIPSITKLGAPSIFDPNKADLSKICGNFKNLYVSKMLQKATIDVNEKGTEAVAVTAAVVDPTDAPQSPKPTAEFHANRPFVYVIQERSSGAIFFIGTFRGE